MKQTIHYEVHQQPYTLTAQLDEAIHRMVLNDREYQVVLHHQTETELSFEVDGKRIIAHVAVDGGKRYVHIDGQTWLLERVARPQVRRREAEMGLRNGKLTAAMPGAVRQRLVSPGEAVSEGATLVILEAMKMELRLTAPFDGMVQAVHCVVGDMVERGQLLVEMAE